MLRIPISFFLLVPLISFGPPLQSGGDPSPRSPEQVLAKFDPHGGGEKVEVFDLKR